MVYDKRSLRYYFQTVLHSVFSPKLFLCLRNKHQPVPFDIQGEDYPVAYVGGPLDEKPFQNREGLECAIAVLIAEKIPKYSEPARPVLCGSAAIQAGFGRSWNALGQLLINTRAHEKTTRERGLGNQELNDELR